MAKIIIKIYEFLQRHRWLCFLMFFIGSALLILSIANLRYKEDITDFLPLNDKNHRALSIFQNISGANNIFAIIQSNDSSNVSQDNIVDALNSFVDDIEEADTKHLVKKITSQVDLEQLTDVLDYVYNNIPYFLTDEDYIRIDSLLSIPNYISLQLQEDKKMLLLPGSSMLSSNISKDPLNLFTPVVTQLQHNSGSLNYEIYDGYIFSPDMQKALVIIDSPFGSSETEKNGQLLEMLQLCADSLMSANTNIDIHLTGGPAIAVGNSKQIKTDSIISVSLAIIIILLLLVFSFRNIKNLLLIVFSIAWGWIFALGGLALCNNNVSIIVLGISSVILGIAVNYPLHFIAHLYHTPKIKETLKEIVTPLIVGNITTVGAFLCLVPLQSIALRDLGIFSSFLLVGTIVFVLIFLPHLAKPHSPVNNLLLDKLSHIELEHRPYFIYIIIALTIIFGYFSQFAGFDSNMSNINYMSKQQKEDMAYLQTNMTKASTSQSIYVVSSGTSIDEALDKSLNCQSYFSHLKSCNRIIDHSSCSHFIASSKEQYRRIKLWNDFVNRYQIKIDAEIKTNAVKEGFAEDSFDDFFAIISKEYHPQSFSYFAPLTDLLFTSNISIDQSNNLYNIVDVLTVEESNISNVKQQINASQIGDLCFDVQSMNSAISNALSDNFNYIGWACGLIVFFFLWFSMGSFELAALSFLPMAISWIWIMGIMGLLNMQFNIVNIILATFIFGQGDDYTIFMTEGASYEYAYRKKLLASYKSSIIISALIMFVGIGTLIFAKHPALHSLAEITIVGMFSVVLMAYIFPPLIFNWLVKNKKGFRMRPIHLKSLLAMLYSSSVFFIQLFFVHIVGVCLFIISKENDNKKHIFHRLVQRLFWFDFTHMPGIRFEIRNNSNEHFNVPAIVTCNHQSMLDSAILMALSPKIVIIANNNASNHRIIQTIFKWMDFITLSDDSEKELSQIHSLISKGYSIAIFPEGQRNDKSSILRFHKGACYLADVFHLDIVPMILHGANDSLPRNSFQLFTGKITVSINERIKIDEGTLGTNYQEQTSALQKYYKSFYAKIVSELETAEYFKAFIMDRYRYKGAEVTKQIKHNLSKFNNYSKWIDQQYDKQEIIVIDSGYGEFALLFALVHKNCSVQLYIIDEQYSELVKYSAEDVIRNVCVNFVKDLNQISYNKETTTLFVVNPNAAVISETVKLSPTIIKYDNNEK